MGGLGEEVEVEEEMGGEKGGLLTWHMIDGFSGFIFFVSSSLGGWWCCGEKKKEDGLQHSWSWGRRLSFVSVCWKRRRIRFALWVHSLKGVKGLREERASSQRSHRVAQLKAISCLGMRTRYGVL